MPASINWISSDRNRQIIKSKMLKLKSISLFHLQPPLSLPSDEYFGRKSCNNKTQYFKLRLFDEKKLTAKRLLRDCWDTAERPLRYLWSTAEVPLKYSWSTAEVPLRIESSKQTWTGRTHKQTLAFPELLVGAKNPIPKKILHYISGHVTIILSSASHPSFTAPKTLR